MDSSPAGIVVSPWCSCRGSGNLEEECEKFLRDFTENPCLRESSHVLPPGESHPLLLSQGPCGSAQPSPPSLWGSFPGREVAMETVGFVLSTSHTKAVTRPRGFFSPCQVKAALLGWYPDSLSQVP